MWFIDVHTYKLVDKIWSYELWRKYAILGFAKMRFTCEQAKQDGNKLAWIDTCCIDKSSSAELSEAINSMYQCEVRFFSQEGDFIASKRDSLPILSSVTDIRSARMSWAARRKCSRDEDIAYSLLGLFDIHMPLIYGEGVKAFQRLQEQIFKSIDDHSLLAWTWADERTRPQTQYGSYAQAGLA
ncbi:hypothetical protein EJ06DRAFT_543554 [Trichodelitschia bisporula]|uniref:DUF8212 domain-containing protein n=1 Tax=Trichodelitschia bisporula TaxID=703511 RepID=A0A6G1HU82_9PEZI|nr:hypothetical protein EJ06DRAFT_543554 [Trichodelitschia bisporula]